MKRKFIVVFTLILLSLPAVKDLFKSGAYTSHDLTHHIVRTIRMDQILKEGQFPPRWVAELNYGYGYPIFIYMYPLPSFIATSIHTLGIDFIWSVKLTFALSMIASSVFAYIFLSYLFHNQAAGFVGGLFYLYAPIRFVNTYVSATFGNAVAFAFVPLIFWALLKAHRREFDRFALLAGSLSLFGLITSHNIMALMFLPLAAIFGVFLLIQKPASDYFKNSSIFGLLGIGLAGFFLLPALLEKHFIRYDSILPGFYQSHFPSFSQLIHSHWGYGFSHPGTAQDDMSFQIGLAHLLVIGLSLAVLLLSQKKNTSSSKQNKLIAVFFLISFAISVFLILPVSQSVWERVPFMPYIQMPWRLLAVSVFAASALAAFIASQSRYPKLAAILLCFAVLVANRHHLRINQIFDPGEDYYRAIDNTTTMASEHLPLGSQKFDNFPPAQARLEIITGDAQVNITHQNSLQTIASINVSQESQIRFNQIYFPGWHYTVDGNQLSPDIDVKHPLPLFSLSPGDHLFKASFGKTPIRKTADIISLASVLILILLTVKPQLAGIATRSKS